MGQTTDGLLLICPLFVSTVKLLFITSCNKLGKREISVCIVYLCLFFFNFNLVTFYNIIVNVPSSSKKKKVESIRSSKSQGIF